MKTYLMTALAAVVLLLTCSCVGKKKTGSEAVSSEAVLSGRWTLTLLRGAALPEEASVPTLEIDLGNKSVSGFGGCNRYTAYIAKHDDTTLELGGIGATRMACLEDQVEAPYFEALGAVAQYRLEPNRLKLLDADGIILLEYVGAEPAPDARLNDIWAVTHIEGEEIKLKELPYFEINTDEMLVGGNNGCNQFTGPLKRATDKVLEFGDLAMTMQMCADMKVPHAINRAMAAVRSYKLDELNLKLYDAEGKLLLTLRKSD